MKQFTEIEKMQEELQTFLLNNRMSPKYTKLNFHLYTEGLFYYRTDVFNGDENLNIEICVAYGDGDGMPETMFPQMSLDELFEFNSQKLGFVSFDTQSDNEWVTGKKWIYTREEINN